jgi:hypothetical protein
MDNQTIRILASIFEHFSQEALAVTNTLQKHLHPTHSAPLWQQIDTAVRRAYSIQTLDHDLMVEKKSDINDCIALFLASTGVKLLDQTIATPRRTINPLLDRGTGSRSAIGANIEDVVCVDFNAMYPSIILRLSATGDIRMDRDLAHILFVLKHKAAIKSILPGNRFALNLYLNFLFGMLPAQDKEKVTVIAYKLTAGMMGVTQHIVSDIDEHYFLNTPGFESEIRDKVGLLELPFGTSRITNLVILGNSRFIAIKDGDNRIRGLPRLSQSFRQQLGGL